MGTRALLRGGERRVVVDGWMMLGGASLKNVRGIWICGLRREG